MPRRQQLFSQTLEPVAKNRIQTLRESSTSDYNELKADDTLRKSVLDSIIDENDFIQVTDQSSFHKVSQIKSDLSSNEKPRNKFITQMQTERLKN